MSNNEEDNYWGKSSIQEKVQQNGMFNLDRFKRSDSLTEKIMDSSRETTVTQSGVFSARKLNTNTANSTASDMQKKTVIPTTKRPTITVNDNPTSHNDQKHPESARAVRTQPLMSPGILPVQSTPSSSPVTIPYNSNKVLEKQWQPTAEDYPNNQVQDGSTLFDYQMKAKCVQLMESKNVMLLNDVKDYDAKESLLRQAVALNTPSVTIPVIMFLENTLSRPLFYELINQHPSAINSYINMCKLRLEKEYYVAMLKQFGKREDVAMLRIRQTSQANDMQTKVTLLTEAMNELHSNVWWHTQVSDYMRLLQKQQLLHSLSHGRSQVENRSLLHTYKVVYNSEFRKPDKHEFKELETNFKMSPELSLYGKLSVIIENGISNNYQEFITTASQPTGILRQKHIISPHILADMVYNASRDSGESMEQASDRAKKFLTMIADPEKRVFYAEKFGNYEVAIDTIVNHLKDRTELENLRRRMPKDHAAINKATMLLDSTKWKN